MAEGNSEGQEGSCNTTFSEQLANSLECEKQVPLPPRELERLGPQERTTQVYVLLP